MTDQKTPGESAVATDKDHQIPPVRSDQMMTVAAAMVCHTINAQASAFEGTAEDKMKCGQSLFAIFVHQLAAYTREPRVIARLLRVVADEMDRLAEDAEKAIPEAPEEQSQ